MAGEHFGVIGKTEQAFFDARAKLFKTATGEVGAPDAAAEERVASEYPTLNLGIEADAALGMAWRADDLQGTLPHLYDFAILQVAVGQLAVSIKRQSKHRCLLPRAKEVVLHVGMCRHINAITFLNGSVAHDVVDVAMRADDHQRLEAMAVDEAEEFIFLAGIGAARVNNDAFLGIVVVYDVCVFRERIKDELFEFEHNHVFRGKGRDFSAVF